MAYASPATYIERDNVLYPNIHHHRDTNIHTNKTTATNIVFNHSDITSKSNNNEYIVFKTLAP